MADIPHFAHPLRIVGGSAQTIEQDSDEDLLLCVSTLLRTEIGSRDELPEYGIEDLAFMPDVTGDITDAIREWEPRVEANTDQEIDDLINRVEVTLG